MINPSFSFPVFIRTCLLSQSIKFPERLVGFVEDKTLRKILEILAIGYFLKPVGFETLCE